MSEENLSQEEQNFTEKKEISAKRHRNAKVFVILAIIIVFAITTFMGIYVKKNQDFKKCTNTYFDTVNNYISNFEGVAGIAASTPRYGLTAVIMQMNEIKTKLNAVQTPFSGLDPIKFLYTQYVNETIDGYKTFLGAGSEEFDFVQSMEEKTARSEIELADTYLTSYKQSVAKVKDILDKNSVFVPIPTLKQKIISVLPK